MAGPIRVRKIDPDGRFKIEYNGSVKELTDETISIDTGWSREPLDLGYVMFEPNDVWLETFYFRRFYNIFRIADKNGVLKGHYCNISEPPELKGDVLTGHDLAIDVWVRPDGSYMVLDLDEFDEKVREPSLRKRALKALDELKVRIEKRDHPFGHRRRVQSSSPDRSSIPSMNRNPAIRTPAAGSAHHHPNR